MKASLSNLKGVALDYAVATAKHLTPNIVRDRWFPHHIELRDVVSEDGLRKMCGRWSPTGDYSLAHSLMNEAAITVIAPDMEIGHWTALKRRDGRLIQYAGTTSEEAIARCFAATVLGDEVVVPDEVVADSFKTEV